MELPGDIPTWAGFKSHPTDQPTNNIYDGKACHCWCNNL